MPHAPDPESPLEELRGRLVAHLAASAPSFGLRSPSLEVAYVPNWGGFVNASFRVGDRGSRTVRVKLAHDPESIAGLRRWRDVATILRDRHRAPKMLGWVALPGTTPYEGPVFEWIEWTVPAARDARLLAEVGDTLRRLHADRDLAVSLGASDARRTCRDVFREGLHREFVEDLRAVGATRPPSVTSDDLAWMRDEAARIVADVAVEGAFDAPASIPCHGDLWLDNLVRGANGRLVILDWDGLSLGDPALDWALFLGPTRGSLRPARASDLPPDLAADSAFRARFDLYARASLFDWALDGLADWIEAAVLGDGAEEVRREKERVSLSAMAAYRAEFPARTREFGEWVAGREYRSRPGCYAVVLDAQGCVAVMSTRKGWFLPGGDLPFVHAVLAGIDERRADIVVEHAAMRPADRTPDDGRGSDGHRRTRPFFVTRCGASQRRKRRTSRTRSMMRPGREFLAARRPRRTL